MATQDDVTNALAALQAEVANDFATVLQQVQTMTSELQAMQQAQQIGASTALDSAVAAINQTTTALHAKYAPVATETTAN